MRYLEIKINQLRIERNYGEAVRLVQARLAQFDYDSEFEKPLFRSLACFNAAAAEDRTDAKFTAEQARNTLEQLHRDQPEFARAIRSSWPELTL